MTASWAAIAAPASGGPDIPDLLLTLAAVLVATKIVGALARRIGQPAVLGELVAGILLGGSVLGVLDPGEPLLKTLAELGVLILLFEVGLETDLQALRRVGGVALTVGVAGIVLPFAGGYAVAAAFGASPITALVIAAAMTATSIGISARVLGDLGRLKTDEGQIVLGAAVFDDVMGLVILAVIGGIAAGAGVTSLGHVFVPVFFAMVGAEVDLRAMGSGHALALGAALIVVAVAGKVAAGFAPWWFTGRKLLVGVAMVPRGEVGLIFAQTGVAAGVLAGGEFGAVIAMVVVTTLLTPPWLGAIAGPPRPECGGPDDGVGLVELVSGAAHRPRRATVQGRHFGGGP